MRTELSIGLVICCLASALVGFAIISNVNAQFRMQPTPMPQPANRIVWDFDSGWVGLQPGKHKYLEHHLGGDPNEYFVYVVGLSSPTNVIHQHFLGGSDLTGLPNGMYDDGFSWRELSNSGIRIYRGGSSNVAFRADHIRVRILKNQ